MIRKSGSNPLVAARHALGRAGEDAAAALLERAGMHIVCRNWRERSFELDIVAWEKDTLVFVEVRTRKSSAMTSALESFHSKKCASLERAAQLYLARSNQWGSPCRFDLICATDTGTALELEHIRNVDITGNESNRHTVGRRNTTWQPW